MSTSADAATVAAPASTTTDDPPPSSSKVSRNVVILLVLRVLICVFLLLALVVISVTEETIDTIYGPKEITFNDYYSYRYMISTIVIGLIYNLLQMALSIYNLVSGKRLIIISSDYFGYAFDFFGDKIISYFLISGSAAGYGISVDLQALSKKGHRHVDLDGFFSKANASASILLLGFLFNAIASVFTSFALPKKA